MDLLEREPLLSSLDDHLRQAAGGDGRMVLLAGEAGIGKTSLARAFCDRHATGAATWWGACDALTTPRPLGPLYDIARAAAGDLAAVMASDASRHERFTALLDAAVSPLQPVIAVIEDIHWADEATRDLLVYLGRRLTGTHALVLVTYRDDEISIDHPLQPVLGHLASLPAVHRLALARLSAAAVARLASRYGADPGELHRVTGGNPFYVTEVLAAGTSGVPATIADAVLARTVGLPPPARAALDAAAIVPDRAAVPLVLAVSGADPDAVEQCVQRGLLHPDDAAMRFRHELARLAVEAAIPATLRPTLHARALAFLADLPGADPAQLTYHAEAAGDGAAVRRHAPAAAKQASDLGAHREATAHYQRALRHATDLPAAERAALLAAYAQECTAIDRAADAIRAAGEAIDIRLSLGEIEDAGILLAQRAYLLWGSGRNDAARDEVRRAVALLEQRPPGVALATAYTYTAHLHMLAREVAPAIELGNRAVSLAEQHQATVLQARALTIVGAAEWFVEPDRAETTLMRALDLARRSGDDMVIGIVMRMLGSGAGEVRRYATADRWLAEGMRWCGEHDLDIHGSYCLAWAARSAFEQGDWPLAATRAHRAVAGPTEHAPTMIVALTVTGRLRARRGDPDPDTPLTEAWRLAQQTGDLQRLWPAAAGRAEAAWLDGAPDRIPELVCDTYRLALTLQQHWPAGELGYWLWKAGSLTEPPPAAAEPYAWQIAGRWREAAAAWDRLGCPYEAALARAEGDDLAELAAALRTFASLGANPMADRTTALLRARGVHELPRRPRRATLANPAGLTARELEVLTLLTTGATNRQIAAELHISPKTAGHHVSAILGKLQARTRRDAVLAARRMGIDGPPAPAQDGHTPPAK